MNVIPQSIYHFAFSDLSPIQQDSIHSPGGFDAQPQSVPFALINVSIERVMENVPIF
jgi:hypothetical protein